MRTSALIAAMLLSAAGAQAAQVEELWNRRYNGPAGREDLLSGLTVDNAGQVYVTGSSDNQAPNVGDPYATLKYSSNGVQQWLARYTGPRQIDQPTAMAIDAIGNVYVTGFSHGTNSGYDPDYLTIKYAPDGSELWVARYNGNNSGRYGTIDTPHAIVVNTAGEVYVTGTSACPSGGMAMTTVKYNTNGAPLWVENFSDAGGVGRALGLDAAGNLYVGGWSPGEITAYDVTVVKYTPAGNRAWVARYPTSGYGSEWELRMKVDAGGVAHVAASVPFRPSTPPTIGLFKFNAEGNLLWNSSYKSYETNGSALLAGLELDEAGNSCIAGTVWGPRGFDYLTLKFDPDGRQLWASRYNSEWQREDHARSIAVDASGDIYVTGVSYDDANRYHFATVKCRPNGHREWVTLASDPSNYGLSGAIVRVDDTGHVYVGGSVGQPGTKDYYAVKYRQRTVTGLPRIETPPLPQTAMQGTTVTFSMTATGDAPISYQWRHNGRRIPGATNSTLTVSGLNYGHRGDYSVEVLNRVGMTVSTEARLDVVVQPFILIPPQPRVSLIGGSAEFSVLAGGTEPFTYQWQRNGLDIPRATNSTLVITNLRGSDAGSYRVLVSNVAGTTPSTPAELTLIQNVQQLFCSSHRQAAGGFYFPQILRVDSQGRSWLAQTLYRDNGPVEFFTGQFDSNGMLNWATNKTFGTNRYNTVAAMTVDSSGNAYVAGQTLDEPRNVYAIVKYDPGGNEVLAITRGSTLTNSRDFVYAIAVDVDGNIYVTGSSDTNTVGHDFLTVKFNTAGVELWARRYTNPDADTSFDVPGDLRVDASGNVYVLGISAPGSAEGTYEFVTLKYDSQGNQVWVRRVPSDYTGAQGAMEIDAAGNIIVTGLFGHAGQDADYITIKYDPNGNTLWSTRYSGYEESFDVPVSLKLDGAGNVYVFSRSTLPHEDDTSLSVFAIAKYDAHTGSQAWVSSHVDDANYGGLDGLAVDAAGNSYLVLSTYGGEDSGSDIETYKYDTNGNRVWMAVTGGDSRQGEVASSVVLAPDGGVLVGGLVYGPPELLLCKYKDSAAAGVPVITQGPRDQDVVAGTNVSFTVEATGEAPLNYQWYFNGFPVAGGTGATLLVQNATLHQQGHYSVRISNSVGQVVSRAAILTIRVPPTIVRQPESRFVLPGNDVTFSVTVTGSSPLYYQWRYNGTNIPGATGSALTLTNVQSADVGAYSVLASNRVSAVTSVNAILGVSPQGRQEWSVRASPGADDELSDMEIDAQDNVYITGRTYRRTADIFTAKYGADGNQLWITYFDVAEAPEAAAAIAIDSQGNSYVTGYSWNTNQQPGFVTIKYDTAGNQVWVRTFRPPGHAFAHDITVGPDGYIYVTGQSAIANQGFATIKYDTNGNQIWIAFYSGPLNQNDTASRVVADRQGNVYVTGSSFAEGTHQDIVTVKYGPAGNRLWAARYAEHGPQSPVDLALDHEGNVIVCAQATFAGDVFLTLKYNSNGVLLWNARYDTGSYLNVPRALAVDGSGNIYVTGTSFIGSIYNDDGSYTQDNDITTVKYSPAGSLLWASRYGGSDNMLDDASDLVLDGQGGLFVAGWVTTEQRGENIVLLRYDTNGNRYWEGHYDGPAGRDDIGLAVRVSGTDSVYVGGNSQNSDAYDDVVVLKYSHQEVAGTPNIVTPPQGQTVIAGNDAMLSVVATGNAPLSYRWYFNGIPIPGATTTSIFLPNVEPTNSGAYTVEVSNDAGIVASPSAFLAVVLPARIVSAPEDQCVVAGSRAIFNVQYRGDGEIGLRWFRNGVAFSNNVSTQLIITNVQLGDAGVYTVTVSNDFGSMTASARLMVTPRAQLAWSSIHSSTNGNQPEDAVVDADGNSYIVGSGPGGYYTVKFDTKGVVSWTRSFNGVNGEGAWPSAIAVGSDGSVYVTGSSRGDGPNNQDFITIKYNASGAQLWQAQFDSGGYDTATDIAVDSATNIYVTGVGGFEDPYNADFATVKYDSNGREVWVARFGGEIGQYDQPVALAVDRDNNVIVTGYTTEGSIAGYSTSDFITIKYDTQGHELWQARHSGPGNADDRPAALALDAAGNIYVTGSHSYDYSVNSGTTVYFDYDYATIKYAPDGTRLWLATYTSQRPAPDQPAAISVDTNGNVFVTGRSQDTPYLVYGRYPQDALVTIKYNTSGEQIWLSRFAAGAYYDAPVAMALDNGDNLYVTAGENVGDILTLKFDTNGTRVWFARYDGPGGRYASYDFPVGIGLDQAGNVFIPAAVDTREGRDFAVLKYSQFASTDSPTITSPPRNQTAAAGSSATFAVTTTGAVPLSYQWRFNGIPIPGQTSATLQLSNARPGDAGEYSVVVYNNIDCVVSAPAVLTVGTPEAVQCTHIERIQNGAVRLMVIGPPSHHYRVEVSSNLQVWETLGSVYNATGTCDHLDDSTSKPTLRFYRVVMQE